MSSSDRRACLVAAAFCAFGTYAGVDSMRQLFSWTAVAFALLFIFAIMLGLATVGMLYVATVEDDKSKMPSGRPQAHP